MGGSDTVCENVVRAEDRSGCKAHKLTIGRCRGQACGRRPAREYDVGMVTFMEA